MASRSYERPELKVSRAVEAEKQGDERRVAWRVMRADEARRGSQNARDQDVASEDGVDGISRSDHRFGLPNAIALGLRPQVGQGESGTGWRLDSGHRGLPDADRLRVR